MIWKRTGMTEFLVRLSGFDFAAVALFVSVMALTLCAACFAAFFFGVRRGKKMNSADIAGERRDAVKKSRAIIGGQVAEQVAAFLPGFPCNPGDVRFVGKPVDFVGFPGASEGKPIEEVLIIEVKTGKSQLSQREKEIRAAVESGRVRYVVYRP